MNHSRTCVRLAYRCGVSQTTCVTGPVRASLSTPTACTLGRRPRQMAALPAAGPCERSPGLCGALSASALWLLVPLFDVEPQLPVPASHGFGCGLFPPGGRTVHTVAAQVGGPGSLWVRARTACLPSPLGGHVPGAR